MEDVSIELDKNKAKEQLEKDRLEMKHAQEQERLGRIKEEEDRKLKDLRVKQEIQSIRDEEQKIKSAQFARSPVGGAIHKIVDYGKATAIKKVAPKAKVIYISKGRGKAKTRSVNIPIAKPAGGFSFGASDFYGGGGMGVFGSETKSKKKKKSSGWNSAWGW